MHCNGHTWIPRIFLLIAGSLGQSYGLRHAHWALPAFDKRNASYDMSKYHAWSLWLEKKIYELKLSPKNYKMREGTKKDTKDNNGTWDIEGYGRDQEDLEE